MMGRRVAGIVIASFVVTSGFLAILAIVPRNASGAILYVGGVGPGNYTTIRGAVMMASSGDTVYVYSGTYSGSGTNIDKELALVGEDRASTVIDGGGVGPSLSITAERVTMENFTISRGWLSLSNTNESRVSNLTLIGSGIWVSYADNNTIADCTLSGMNTGIEINDADNNTFVRNTISDSLLEGIYVSFSNHNFFRNNSVSGSSRNGVWLRDSHDNTFDGNDITASAQNGMQLDYSGGNIVSNGSVSQNAQSGIYVHSDVPANTTFLHNNISLNGDFGVWLRADGTTLTANTLTANGDAGIAFDSSAGGTLRDNVMVRNGIFIYGWDLGDWTSHTIDTSNTVNGKPVYYWKNMIGGTVPPNAGQVILANAKGVTVRDQVISDATVGVLLGISPNNTILRNSLANHSRAGMFLARGSDNNTVTDNSVRNSSSGMFFAGSRTNSIIKNVFTENREGISSDSSAGNEFTYNTVSNNNIGFNIYAADGSRFHHNNILGNTQQATQAMGVNFWDDGYPSGGNYWSDYTGVDLNGGPGQGQPGSDGIGDTPYVCAGSGGVVDNYPLMQPAVPSPPSAPINLVAVAGDAQVSLTWSPPVSNGTSSVTNYTVHRGTVSGGEVILATLGDVLAYTDAGLTNGVTYFYTVAAVNSIGQGPDSAEVNATPVTVPSVPLNLTVEVQDTTVLVRWNPPASDGGSPILKYRIYRISSNGTEILLTTVWVTAQDIRVYPDTAVERDQTYRYRVSAVNAVGEGPKTNEVTATVPPITLPPKSILDEVWFWAIIVAVIIILVAVAAVISRRKKRKKEVGEPPTQEQEDAGNQGP
jgi:parallel beta-helix repeat protein